MDKQYDKPTPLSYTCSGVHPARSTGGNFQCFEAIKQEIQNDLQELENTIYPKFQEVASNIPVQKAFINKHSPKLTEALKVQKEYWHREINNIIKKMELEIAEQESKQLALLEKHEDEITQRMYEIVKNIDALGKLLKTDDECTVSSYKSRNDEFRRLPPKLTVSLPSFIPHDINREHLYQQFGSLSAFYIKEEDRKDIKNSSNVEHISPNRKLIDEPQIIMEINHGYGNSEVSRVASVSCLSDEFIWITGQDKMIRLYNLQGEVITSIQTNSTQPLLSLASTNCGDLVYTDTTTVNIVKNKKIHEVIRLQRWYISNICSTSVGDLLVIMSKGNVQTKVVRYSGSIEKQVIPFNEKSQPLYSRGGLKAISENKNKDICVADFWGRAVVVVDHAGQFRFTYNGKQSISRGAIRPVGITTDSQSRILAAGMVNNGIHILDQNGQFVGFISSCIIHFPHGICVDSRGNLFVAEKNGKVKKIKYCM